PRTASGRRPHPRLPPTSPSPEPSGWAPAAAAPAARLPMLDTGFSPLTERGKEAAGYGLYSYALVVSDSTRSAAFLAELFRSTPSIHDTAASPAQTNIFYVPLQKDKLIDFAAEARLSGGDPSLL